MAIPSRLQNIISGSDHCTDFTKDTDEGYDLMPEYYDTYKQLDISNNLANNKTKEIISFMALDTLNKSEPKLIRGANVKICLFRIVKKTNIPFLQYGLYKDIDNLLKFLEFDYIGGLASHIAITKIKEVLNEHELILTYTHLYESMQAYMSIYELIPS